MCKCVRPNTRDGAFVYSKIFIICSSCHVKLFLGLHVVHVRVKCLRFQKDIWHSKSKNFKRISGKIKVLNGNPAFHGKLCSHFTFPRVVNIDQNRSVSYQCLLGKFLVAVFWPIVIKVQKIGVTFPSGHFLGQNCSTLNHKNFRCPDNNSVTTFVVQHPTKIMESHNGHIYWNLATINNEF